MTETFQAHGIASAYAHLHRIKHETTHILLFFANIDHFGIPLVRISSVSQNNLIKISSDMNVPKVRPMFANMGD